MLYVFCMYFVENWCCMYFGKLILMKKIAEFRSYLLESQKPWDGATSIFVGTIPSTWFSWQLLPRGMYSRCIEVHSERLNTRNPNLSWKHQFGQHLSNSNHCTSMVRNRATIHVYMRVGQYNPYHEKHIHICCTMQAMGQWRHFSHASFFPICIRYFGNGKMILC